MTTVRVPSGLGVKGRRLWRELTTEHDFGPAERVLLEEACRIADRLDRLDGLIGGSAEDWIRLVEDKGDPERQIVTIDAPLSEARQQANVMKQLVAALRLPDEATGKRPQQRGGARGSYTPSAKKSGSKVSSLDAARAARSG